MRTLAVLALLALAGSAPPVLAKSRTIGCCLAVSIPGLTPEPRCVVVNLHVRRGRIGPRLVCRLAGGDPIRHGTCTCPPGTVVNPS